MTQDLESIREFARRSVNLPAQVAVLVGGKVFTSGTCVVRDISFKGALLVKFKLKQQVFPVRPFKIRFVLTHPKHKGIGGVAKPVRLGVGREFELGVEFEEFWAGEQA